MVVDAADGKGELCGKICQNVEASLKSDMWRHLISLGQEIREKRRQDDWQTKIKIEIKVETYRMLVYDFLFTRSSWWNLYFLITSLL